MIGFLEWIQKNIIPVPQKNKVLVFGKTTPLNKIDETKNYVCFEWGLCDGGIENIAIFLSDDAKNRDAEICSELIRKISSIFAESVGNDREFLYRNYPHFCGGCDVFYWSNILPNDFSKNTQKDEEVRVMRSNMQIAEHIRKLKEAFEG